MVRPRRRSSSQNRPTLVVPVSGGKGAEGLAISAVMTRGAVMAEGLRSPQLIRAWKLLLYHEIPVEQLEPDQ